MTTHADNEKAVAAIITAAKASVQADDRSIEIAITHNDVSVPLPVMLDGNGSPKLLADVVALGQSIAETINPTRRADLTMHDLASLCAWAARYKTEDTQAYVMAPNADGTGQVTVVIDDVPASGKIGGKRNVHAALDLALSDRLNFWLKHANKWMSAEQFQAFADRACDELATAEVITMINNIEINSETTWKRTVDENGRVKLVDESKQGPSARIPQSFQFKVPVFDFDSEENGHTFTARLTMKIEGRKPTFAYEVTDFGPRIAEAMQVIRDQIKIVVPNTYMGVAP